MLILNLKEAIEKSENNSEVNKIKDKDGFLCSAYVMLGPKDEIDKWNLNYYDPEDETITLFEVSSDVKKVETDKPVNPDVESLELENLDTEGNDILEKAKKEAKKFGQPITKIILSLQKNEWSINFVTTNFSAIMVKMDMESGEVKDVETTSLME